MRRTHSSILITIEVAFVNEGFSYLFGARYLEYLCKENFPAVFFPGVEIAPGVQGKYGVISRAKLEEDLSTWRYLSMAGRLHKPVRFIKRDSSLENQMAGNLKFAVEVAAYLNPQHRRLSEESDRRQILKTIVGLSYLGDIRTTVGAESSDKIDNLLQGNRLLLDKLYEPIFADVKSRCNHADQQIFPLALRNLQSRRDVLERISSINRESSRRMVVNQILTDSPSRNLRYLWSKLKKGILKGK